MFLDLQVHSLRFLYVNLITLWFYILFHTVEIFNLVKLMFCVLIPIIQKEQISLFPCSIDRTKQVRL